MDVAYKKHFIPLESNPDVFNNLIRLLGAPPSLSFQDVWSLELSLPYPVLALILVFPTTESYENRKTLEDAGLEDGRGGEVDDDIIWFKQTINNACGLYGILHALCNGPARDLLETNSLITRLLEACSSLPPGERCSILENSLELERAYKEVASQGTSRIPDSAEDEVDFHYVCFVKSHRSGRLYELDGDRKGPINREVVLGPEDDVLASNGVNAVREYIEHEHGDLRFSLMALVYHG